MPVTSECELIGPYVLDAVSEQERAAFVAHLNTCDRCQGEIGSLYEVAALLGTTDPVAPPPDVRAAVLARVSPAPVPTATRRTALRWTLAAAAALVVGAGATGTISGWRTAQQRDRLLAERRTLLSAPDAQLVTTQIGATGRGSYLVSKQANRALFTASGLPTLPAGRLFQQWTIVGQNPVPDVTFTELGDGIFLTGDVRDAAALAMSIEPGPATSPTTDQIIALAKLA